MRFDGTFQAFGSLTSLFKKSRRIVLFHRLYINFNLFLTHLSIKIFSYKYKLDKICYHQNGVACKDWSSVSYRMFGYEHKKKYIYI